MRPPGGPQALQWGHEALGGCEALVRHAAIGLNVIDAHHRSGLLHPLPLSSRLGVEAVGEGVDLAVGDQLGYAGHLGACAEASLEPARAVW